MTNVVTTPRNGEIKDIAFALRKVNYPHDGSAAAFDYMQGDLLYWNSANKKARPLDGDANAAFLLGVALRGAYIAPYSSMQQTGGPGLVKNYFLDALIGFGAVFTFFSTAGDTYAHGQPVYWGGVANNPQTITNTAGANVHSLGTVYIPSPGTSTIAGGATVLVPVLVIPQFPIQSL